MKSNTLSRRTLETELLELRDAIAAAEVDLEKKKTTRNRTIRRILALDDAPAQSAVAVMAGISQPMVNKIGQGTG